MKKLLLAGMLSLVKADLCTAIDDYLTNRD